MGPRIDLALIVSRALDLLLQELLQRRFGAQRKDTSRHAAHRAANATSIATATAANVERPAATPIAAAAPPAPPLAASPLAASPPAAPRSRVPRAVRREVLERDGLGCGWLDATGKRCGSTAWLELDHRHPSGKGGSSAPENLRWLCRAHNRFAAERAYGRDHIERAIQARQRSTQPHCPGGPPPSASPEGP